jgi:pentatricopeptide repeat protein
MLPKLAGHILHHTPRAAAAVQGQSAYIRNVLQLQSSAGPSAPPGGLGGWSGAGSSSWGSQGAGPGGAKYHAGSRFYSGFTVSMTTLNGTVVLSRIWFSLWFSFLNFPLTSYVYAQGSGRTLTQANASSSQDGLPGQSDDTEELQSKRVSLHQVKKTRMRSSSFSTNVPARSECEESLGVLKSVQLHVRSLHAVAADGPGIAEPSDVLDPLHAVTHPSPVLVRRNSTTATTTTSDPPGGDQLPFSPIPIPVASLEDPAAPQSAGPPPPPPNEDASCDSPAYLALKVARESRDAARVVQEVKKFRATAVNPTVVEFNMAFEGLRDTRVEGDPLTFMLETYNDMVSRSVYPNTRTYLTLILALTERDHEVHKAITSLELRNKRLALWGREDYDEQRIRKLREENNFPSAVSLFEAATAIAVWRRIPPSIYSNLIQSAALHGNVDAAISVFAHLEKRKDILPTPLIYANMVGVYANVGDTIGAKEVFDEFRRASREGGVVWDARSTNQLISVTERIAPSLRAQVAVWNKMIETYFRGGQPVKALGLLEEMMDATTGSGFDPGQPPSPASSTYTHIIAGFCQLGDTTTALSWFDRLLQHQTPAGHPLQPSTLPPRPDHVSWAIMIEHLAQEHMVQDLNRIFTILLANAAQDRVQIRTVDCITVSETNLQALDAPDMPDDRAIAILDFVSEQVLPQAAQGERATAYGSRIRSLVDSLVRKYLQHNSAAGAYRALESFIRSEVDRIRQAEDQGSADTEKIFRSLSALRALVCAVSPDILECLCQSRDVSFDSVFQVARFSDSIGLLPYRPVAPYYLHVFASRASSGRLDFSLRDWELLLYAAAVCELPRLPRQEPCPEIPNYAFAGLPFLLQTLASYRVSLDKLNPAIIRQVIKALFLRVPVHDLNSLFARLGPAYERILNNPEPDLLPEQQSLTMTAVPTIPATAGIRCDISHSRYIDQHFPSSPNVSSLQAYARFEAGMKVGSYPLPATIGRLINSLGRIGEFEKVRVLYDVGQLVLSGLEGDKERQSQGWFQIEDSMIIAYAHGGNVDAAHVHRERILEQGGAPTADAYGALIHSVKDTTDDCLNALALYQESQEKTVPPSVFLFNTIISKLARARKADYAVELFQQMKASGCHPSSITFGAVIAACARVGDAHSAEMLFDEMIRQPNFRPRIPPYNTMIQMYTTVKPNRERALHYYTQLRNQGIHPTSHTYKVKSIRFAPACTPSNSVSNHSFSLTPTGPSSLSTLTRWRPCSTNSTGITMSQSRVLIGPVSSMHMAASEKTSTRRSTSSISSNATLALRSPRPPYQMRSHTRH